MNSSATARTWAALKKGLFASGSAHSVQISPDGNYVSWLSGLGEDARINVSKVEVSLALSSGRSFPSPGIRGYIWLGDSKAIVYLSRHGVPEREEIYRVSIEGDRQTEERRLVFSEARGRVRIHKVTDGTRPQIFFSVFGGCLDSSFLYRLDIDSGRSSSVFEGACGAYSYLLDSRGEVRFYLAVEGSRRHLYRVSGNCVVCVEGLSVTEFTKFLSWDDVNQTAYLASKDEVLGTRRLYSCPPLTAEAEAVSKPSDHDVGGCIFEPTTGELLGYSYQASDRSIHWLSRELEQVDAALIKFAEGDQAGWVGTSSDLDRILVKSSSWHLYDRRLGRCRPLNAIDDGSHPKSYQQRILTYSGSDGLEIQAVLSLPNSMEEAEKSPRPFVIFVHGGPLGVSDKLGYNPIVEFLTSCGFGVLQPNFRGSGGRGLGFMEAIYGEWSRLALLDIELGVREVVERGLANPERLGIMGASFGGYAALASSIWSRANYACCVAISPPCNLLNLLRSLPAYWSHRRGQFVSMLGDPDTESGIFSLRQSSPSFHVDRFNSPVLLFHGMKDDRVPWSDTLHLAQGIRGAGGTVTCYLVPDESHFFKSHSAILGTLAACGDFLNEYLNGASLGFCQFGEFEKFRDKCWVIS